MNGSSSAFLVALLTICIGFYLYNGSQSLPKQDLTTSTQCSFYMAPSSIPNAGFGVYTTRTILKDEPVTHYADAPSIITVDVAKHSENDLGDYWTHIDYLWSGIGFGEFECSEAEENVFNLGCLANYHTYLKNIKPQAAPYNDSYLDRYSDPGVGAFTYHEGHLFHATRTIEAGEELFADYGEEWLDTRGGTFADAVPRFDDFSQAANVVNELEKSMKVNKIVMKDEIVSTIVDIIYVFNERVANAIPRTAHELSHILTLEENSQIEAALAKQTVLERERNTKWIEENGICLELIKPGKSTIKQAGRGAFATGFIAKGSLVSPMPLNIIVDRDMMLMYELKKDPETGNKVKVEGSAPIGQQLVVNYCFGHKESKLLLCPMTNSILINHCSKSSAGEGHCKHSGPNAKVQWATSWDKDTSKWLKMPLNEISDSTALGHRGLSLEVIATRDIAPGEEVFIDYGKNWEDAWIEHVQSWEPPDSSTTGTYGSITTLRQNKDFRTLDELVTNPYQDNVILVCYFPQCTEEDINEMDTDRDKSTTDIVVLGGHLRSKNGVEQEEELYECNILEKGFYSFTVRVFCPSETTYLVTSYSKDLVTFRMKPYRSDQHLRGAFRHFIEIEDDIFPDHWKIQEEIDV